MIRDNRQLHPDGPLVIPRGFRLVFCWMQITSDPAPLSHSSRNAALDAQYAHVCYPQDHLLCQDYRRSDTDYEVTIV